jgi:putative DNA primase/helicase
MNTPEKYVQYGMAIIPIPFGQKRPIAKEWNKSENVVTDPRMASRLTENIGLAHAYCSPTPTMALDIDDMERASAWLAARNVDLANLLNAEDAVQIVSGRPGRAKLLYRLPADLAPIESLTIKQEVCIDG